MIIDVKLFGHGSDSSATFIFSTYFYTFRIRRRVAARRDAPRRNSRSSNDATASRCCRILSRDFATTPRRLSSLSANLFRTPVAFFRSYLSSFVRLLSVPFSAFLRIAHD